MTTQTDTITGMRTIINIDAKSTQAKKVIQDYATNNGMTITGLFFMSLKAQHPQLAEQLKKLGR